MNTYQVVLDIEVLADSEKEAALKARKEISDSTGGGKVTVACIRDDNRAGGHDFATRFVNYVVVLDARRCRELEDLIRQALSASKQQSSVTPLMDKISNILGPKT